jgi:hypothetical protein
MALDTRILTESSAEEFVRRNKNTRWEGWDIITFVPNKRAWKMPEGRFNRETGQWGLEYRTSPNNKGLWTVQVSVPSRK